MANRHAEVLVIGGGITGASIAYHLLNSGISKVVLCEQHRLPGVGATRMSGGLIRMHHTHPSQMKLAWESYYTYAYWPEVIGGSCGFRVTGFAMIVGPEQVDSMQRNVAEMEREGIPVWMLTPEEYKQWQPFCSTERIGGVAYEPGGGYADPVAATLGFITRAQQLGLKVMEGTRVERLLIEQGNVCGIHTNTGPLFADHVILCGNTWVKGLLDELDVKLPITSRAIGVCLLDWCGGGSTPIWTTVDDSLGTYYRSNGPNQLLVGLKLDQENPFVNKQEAAGYSEMIKAKQNIRHRFPHVSAISGSRLSFDGYTPDQHPMIGSVSGHKNVVVATGFSGGGFKIAPAVGRNVAEYILTGNISPGMKEWAPDRFEKGKNLKAVHPYVHL
ncbi:NAD(P)/FAD-dependent oxidoreductase [Desmospora profundinema]|uniref:Glycine/D-amino acid oxidase-like deaminating enzyme n=1 Tax=Desmospora profundinema TaxID=1571184 RepID=A0ABU1IRH9_9BACL|nr:FAD-dependent oxidoreductase [Desmospora profundinema]MDR6227355.1 glycine/D-amino acid oxidase-like deaminating enzyme [Desmospora profundinema]